uniref:ZMYM2-like/QRICH1 C-terminal domain-containing protein n=1 Tax=Biomphalaria glabrata TaxID=6526 RepID=A0A2C9KPM5_BIOGL
MEALNANYLHADEICGSKKNVSERNQSNNDEIAEDKKNDNEDNDNNRNKDVPFSDITDDCQESHDESVSGGSESDLTGISDEAVSSKHCSNDNSALLDHNHHNGPVFPARHRDLQLAFSHSSVDAVGLSSATNLNDDQSTHAMKKAILSYIDKVEDKSITSNSKMLKRSSSVLSSQESNFTGISLSNNSVSNSSSNLENISKGVGEADNEILPPLNASLFNCQFQTPSWIDDPLIGVPASAMENKNTHRKTGADMRILTAYMRSLNEMRLPEAIPPNDLDKYLSSFFLVVRKADGSEYEPCSLRAMLASIERYLRFKNYPLSLTRDSAFSNMRNVLKLKQQTLRSIGKGQKTPSEVSPSTLAREGKIAHLFKSQEMGPYTPSSVVFTLCFYFCMYLRLRKSTENKKLLWGDIVLCKDDNGREFLTFSSQMLRRTQSSSKLNLKQRIFRVWADPSCPEKDPVTIYKFYAQKRPTSMNTNFAPFYLGINVLYPTQGQLWYRPAAMGINKLNEMVRQIRDITGVRSTSDFNSELNMADRHPPDPDGQEEHSPLHDMTDRQEAECEVKMEAADEGNEDEGNYNLAVDFSQDQRDPPLDCSQHNGEGTSSVHQLGGGLLSNAHSDEDNSNDSSSQHSFPSNINGDASQDVRNGKDNDKEIDLTQRRSPEFPLNCSTKKRSYTGSDALYQFFYPGAGLSDILSVDDAKQHLMSVVKKMDLRDIMEFEQWLKRVKFIADPHSGEVVCKEEEPMNVRANTIPSSQGASITLNISLTPQAMQGDGPITVTALTSIPSEQQRNSSSSKPSNQQSKNYSSLKQSSAFPLVGLPHGLVGSAAGQSSPDKPLDLVTSPVNRNTKSSTSSYQSKTSRLHGGNGIFPSMASGSSSTSFDSSLAKRLRMSAEQAEAYTSASIMASLSSANLVSERLRLQLMQAGLRMGEYGLDAHTAGLMEMASTEALRSQLLQHYGIKSEPK